MPHAPQWFARFGNPNADITVPAYADLGSFWRSPSEYRPIDGKCRTRLWRLTSSVRERQRSGGPFTPLTRQQIQAPEGAGESASDRTMAYRLRLDMVGEGPPRSVVVDPGQPLEFYAEQCSVALLGPSTAQNVDAVSTITPLSGFVVDTIIGAKLIQVEEAIGALDALFSQTLSPGSSADIPVPAGARDVVIYQADDDTAPSSPWGQYYGEPSLAGSWRIGALEFHPTQRQTLGGQLLPGVTHLRTNGSIAVDRQFVIVWTIRP